MSKLTVGIVGYGYWGPNLVRNFSASPLTEVVAVCDADPRRLEPLKVTHRHLHLLTSLDQFLDLPLDAVAVATPVHTHARLVRRCLEHGLHVLVEKPLAANANEAQELVDLAERQQRVLMVDHTYLFTNAVQLIKKVVDQGELGDLYFVDSVRINLGLIRNDVSVVWDLAPHDFAIVDYLLDDTARSVSAWGCAHTDPGLDDIAYVNVGYHDRLMANFHVNWLSPVKVRQMIFAGSRKSLIFNELNTSEPVKIFDRGVELGAPDDRRRRLLIGYRSGEVRSPHVEPGEALQAVAKHFAERIRDGGRPLSDGALGVRVVRMLEAATQSIAAQGQRVLLDSDPSYGANGHGRYDGCINGPSVVPGRQSGEQRDDALFREPLRL